MSPDTEELQLRVEALKKRSAEQSQRLIANEIVIEQLINALARAGALDAGALQSIADSLDAIADERHAKPGGKGVADWITAAADMVSRTESPN